MGRNNRKPSQRLITRQDYLLRELRETQRILNTENSDADYDKDIHNLELILYSIKPNSLWWKRGCIRSLRRAIKALKKGNEHARKQ